MDQRPPIPRRTGSLFLRAMRALGGFWLRINGWKVRGHFPDTDKFVIVAAPHTSNWDLPYMLAAGLQYGVRPNWIGKHTIFNPPFGGLMRWMGGIAVNRTARFNAVAQMVAEFEKRDQLILVVSPEGTRKAVSSWKSGFYHIAVGAGVPLALGYLDYKRKVGGIGMVMTPSGDYDADMKIILEFYSGITGRNPANQMQYNPQE